MKLSILGTRGIPAGHGGFETFAENLAIFLIQEKWQVDVYCQTQSLSRIIDNSQAPEVWCGVNLIKIGTSIKGPLGSLIFDFASMIRASRESGSILILGYNTGFLSFIPFLFRKKVAINMDGFEWKRSKWNAFFKLWFRLNEKLALSFISNVIADHPKVFEYLKKAAPRSNIKTIPYGAKVLESYSKEVLAEYKVNEEAYIVSICRLEPENMVHMLLESISKSNEFEDIKVLVFGKIEEGNKYHLKLLELSAACSGRIIFAGVQFDYEKISSLRKYSLAYYHGHTVGGTNPSLVEALAAGSCIIAHSNCFNRWVAGDSAIYFDSEQDIVRCLKELRSDPKRQDMRRLALVQFRNNFTWDNILHSYKSFIESIK